MYTLKLKFLWSKTYIHFYLSKVKIKVTLAKLQNLSFCEPIKTFKKVMTEKNSYRK